MFIEIPVFNANSLDPDQTPRSAASELGLACLPMSHLWDARHNTDFSSRLVEMMDHRFSSQSNCWQFSATSDESLEWQVNTSKHVYSAVAYSLCVYVPKTTVSYFRILLSPYLNGLRHVAKGIRERVSKMYQNVRGDSLFPRASRVASLFLTWILNSFRNFRDTFLSK